MERMCSLFKAYLIIAEIMEVPFDGFQCKRLLIIEQAEDTIVTQCQQESPPDQLWEDLLIIYVIFHVQRLITNNC